MAGRPSEDSALGAAPGSDPAPPEGADQLVVIGASAGGIDALGVLLASLPAEFPAPIVIAQHLDPSRTSHLPEILARRSTLPVRVVGDRERLGGGVVHLVPADRHVEIVDDAVRLADPPKGGRMKPSIDHLLTTAANAYGENLVAVILTGLGSDGTVGAAQVKAHGGTVVIQDPRSASFPSMPAALPPSSVDVVSELESLGGLLFDLVTRPLAPDRPDDERVLDSFLAHLRDQSGIDFSAYKRPTILRRLQRRMAATDTTRLRDYVRHVDRNPDEYRRLISDFLIKVTEFFRDPDLFDHLRDVVIPALIAGGRDRGRELRVWSAGCSTGQEAYSVAMLIADGLGDELHQWTVRVFATDLDNDAILYARRGIYPASALADLPQDLVDRHFVPTDGHFQVSKTVRQLTVFGQHDLARGAPFPRIDLALCRNVLIYFTPELQKRALQLFAFSVREGGYIVLGSAETTSPLGTTFVADTPRLKVYRRHGERVLAPPSSRRSSPDLPADGRRTDGGRRPVSFAPSLGGRDDPARSRTQTERAEALLLRLPVGLVVVDDDYDIALINDAARAMFGIHGSAIGQDFIHLARTVDSTELRAAIDAALHGRSRTFTQLVAPGDSADGRARWLEVRTHRLEAAVRGEAAAVSVMVEDVTETREGLARVAGERDAERGQRERLTGQLGRLVGTNQQLLDDNSELAGTAAALRSANDELLIAHEESQAAMEEAETLNEELQATNEELETLNEELQATVEELNATTEDMSARAIELSEMSERVEQQHQASNAERVRLAAVLRSMRDALVAVGPDGSELLRNPAFERFTAQHDLLLENDGGTAATRAVPLLLERASRGETFTAQLRATDDDGQRRWMEAVGQPFTEPHQGGLLVIRDITERSLRRLQEEFVAILAHELRTPLTAIQGYLQLLAAHPEDAGRYAPLSLAQLERMRALIADLFDTARIETGAMSFDYEDVPLARILRDAVSLVGTVAERHRITLDVPPESTLRARVDARRLQQVVLNVITNAITHAPDADHIEVRLREADGAAEIEIEDNGPGVPSDEIDSIFDRFRKNESGRRSSGLGLGLFLARQIAAAHGGSIDARSEPGRGLTIRIRLPLIADGASPAR